MKRGFAAHCRSVRRKVYPPFVWLAKIPTPSAPETGFPLRFNKLLGCFGIFTTAHRVVVPHFRFKKGSYTLFEFIPRCKQRGIQI